jgi:hypothetical protein
VWEAVQNKGNVVRLGPKELLVNTYDGGVRTIYSGGFEKPNWYEFFINHGYVCALLSSRIHCGRVVVV